MVKLLIVGLATLAVTLAAPGFDDYSSEVLSGLRLGQNEEPRVKPTDNLKDNDRFKLPTEEKVNTVKEVNVATTSRGRRRNLKTDGIITLNDKPTLVPSLGIETHGKTKMSNLRNRGSIKYNAKTTAQPETDNAENKEIGLFDRGDGRYRVGGSKITIANNKDFVVEAKFKSKISMPNDNTANSHGNLADSSAEVNFRASDDKVKTNFANLDLPGKTNKKNSETVNSRINIAAKNLENFKVGSEEKERLANLHWSLGNETDTKNIKTNIYSEIKNTGSSTSTVIKNSGKSLNFGAKQRLISNTQEIVNSKRDEKVKNSTDTALVTQDKDVKLGKEFDSFDVDFKLKNKNSSKVLGSDENMSVVTKQIANFGSSLSENVKVRSEFDNKMAEGDVYHHTTTHSDANLKHGIKQSHMDSVEVSNSTVLKKSEALKIIETDKDKTQNTTGTMVNNDFNKINGVDAEIKNRRNTRNRNRGSTTTKANYVHSKDDINLSNKQITSHVTVESTDKSNNSATFNVEEENKKQTHTRFRWDSGNESETKFEVKFDNIDPSRKNKSRISSADTNYSTSGSLSTTQYETANTSYGSGIKIGIELKGADTLKLVEAEKAKENIASDLSPNSVNQKSLYNADKTQNSTGVKLGLHYSENNIENKHGNLDSGVSTTVSNLNKNSIGINKSVDVGSSLSDDVKVRRKLDSKLDQVETVIYSDAYQGIKQSLKANNRVKSGIITVPKESENKEVPKLDNVKTRIKSSSILNNDSNKIEDKVGAGLNAGIKNRGNSRYHSAGNSYDTGSNILFEYDKSNNLNEQISNITASRVKSKAAIKSGYLGNFNVVEEKHNNTSPKLENKFADDNGSQKLQNVGSKSSEGTSYGDSGSLDTKQRTTINASDQQESNVNIGLKNTEGLKVVKPEKGEVKAAFDFNSKQVPVLNHESFDNQGQTLERTSVDFKPGRERERSHSKFGSSFGNEASTKSKLISSDVIVNSKNGIVDSSVSNQKIYSGINDGLGVQQNVTGKGSDAVESLSNTGFRNSGSLHLEEQEKDKSETSFDSSSQNSAGIEFQPKFDSIEVSTKNENKDSGLIGVDLSTADHLSYGVKQASIPKLHEDKIQHSVDIRPGGEREKSHSKFSVSFGNEASPKSKIISSDVDVNSKNEMERSDNQKINSGVNIGLGLKQSVTGKSSDAVGSLSNTRSKISESHKLVEKEKDKNSFDLRSRISTSTESQPKFGSIESGTKNEHKGNGLIGVDLSSADHQSNGVKQSSTQKSNKDKIQHSVNISPGRERERSHIKFGSSFGNEASTKSELISSDISINSKNGIVDSSVSNQKIDSGINVGLGVKQNVTGKGTDAEESVSNTGFKNSESLHLEEQEKDKSETSFDLSSGKNGGTKSQTKFGNIIVGTKKENEDSAFGGLDVSSVEHLSYGVKQASIPKSHEDKIQHSLDIRPGGEREKSDSKFSVSFGNEASPKSKIIASDVDVNSENEMESSDNQKFNSGVNIGLGLKQSVTSKSSDAVESLPNTGSKLLESHKLVEKEKDNTKNSFDLRSRISTSTESHPKFGNIEVGTKNENKGNGLIGVDLSTADHLSYGVKQASIPKSNEDKIQHSVDIIPGREKEKSHSKFGFGNQASTKSKVISSEVDVNSKNGMVRSDNQKFNPGVNVGLGVKQSVTGKSSDAVESLSKTGSKISESDKLVEEEKDNTKNSFDLVDADHQSNSVKQSSIQKSNEDKIQHSVNVRTGRGRVRSHSKFGSSFGNEASTKSELISSDVSVNSKNGIVESSVSNQKIYSGINIGFGVKQNVTGKGTDAVESVSNTGFKNSESLHLEEQEKGKSDSSFNFSSQKSAGTESQPKLGSIEVGTKNENKDSGLIGVDLSTADHLSYGVKQASIPKSNEEKIQHSVNIRPGREKEESYSKFSVSFGNEASPKSKIISSDVDVNSKNEMESSETKNENKGNGLIGVDLSSADYQSNGVKQSSIQKSNEDKIQHSVNIRPGRERERSHIKFGSSFGNEASTKSELISSDVSVNSKNGIVESSVFNKKNNSGINLGLVTGSSAAESVSNTGFKKSDSLKLVEEKKEKPKTSFDLSSGNIVKNKTNISIYLNSNNEASTKENVKLEGVKTRTQSNVKINSTGDQINLGRTASLGLDKMSRHDHGDDASISVNKNDTLSFLAQSDNNKGIQADFVEKYDSGSSTIVKNADSSKIETDFVVTVGQYVMGKADDLVSSAINTGFKKGDSLKIDWEESGITLTVLANNTFTPINTTNTRTNSVTSNETPEIKPDARNSLTSKNGSDCNKDIEKLIVHVNIEKSPTDSNNRATSINPNSHGYNIINFIFNVNKTLSFFETKGEGKKIEATSSSQNNLSNVIFGNVVDLRNKYNKLPKESTEGKNRKITNILV